MRVLWLGDAGAHTGFARVTHAIGERLVSKGHDVHVLASQYKGDYVDTTLKLYLPTRFDPKDYYGRSRIMEMLGQVEPDVVVMNSDPWTVLELLFENRYDPQRMLLKYRPLAAYMPIDGHNLPPTWDVLASVTRRIAYTKFAQRAMPEAPVVYHGIDEEIFHPVSSSTPITTSTGVELKSKRDCKKAFGFDPDGFLVLRVDTNTDRKDFAATWKALVPVLKRHSDIKVHFHCIRGIGNASTNLDAVIDRDPETKDRFFFPDIALGRGWPTEDLVALYNAADLFVSTSRGEGFGLTIAEAMACAVPVVAQNVSALPEVVGPGGVLVEPQREITASFGMDQWLADISAFSEAIEHLYLSGGVRRKLGEAGRQHIKSFDWDVAADLFEDILTGLTEGQREPESALRSGRQTAVASR